MFRSLTTRLVLSHILTAIVTSVFVILCMVIAIQIVAANLPVTEYRSFASLALSRWMLEWERRDLLAPARSETPGFTLIAAPEGEVVYVEDEIACTVGDALADCAPELLDLPPGERYYDRDGKRWAEIVTTLPTGHRVLLRRGPAVSNPKFSLGAVEITGGLQIGLFLTAIVALLALLPALAFGWLLAGPMTRRLSRVARVSQQLAQGEFSARVRDRHTDEVGQLARRMDDMADALENNISALRELAQRNAQLAQDVEQVAVQNERMRLSRDLHDAIAQRLFSLTASTASLPALIEQDAARGATQARTIAELAENTLLDLRALLVDLRPTNLLRYDLGEALRKLGDEWNSMHRVPVEFSLFLPNGRASAVVEDVIYRVTEESLNNIAKHASASHVAVTVVQGRQSLTLSVTDDGRGFDAKAQRSTGKFGLTGMRERVQSIGGRFSIESSDRGTTIQAVLPYEGA